MPTATTERAKRAKHLTTKSHAQVKAIFGRAKERDLTDDELRSVVEEVTGQRSISALNRQQADKVIVRLGGTAHHARRTVQHRRQRAGVNQIVSPAHLELLRTLARSRNWCDRTIDEFCIRQCGHARPRTTKDANKVIEALKAMNARDADRRDELLKGVA